MAPKGGAMPLISRQPQFGNANVSEPHTISRATATTTPIVSNAAGNGVGTTPTLQILGSAATKSGGADPAQNRAEKMPKQQSDVLDERIEQDYDRKDNYWKAWKLEGIIHEIPAYGADLERMMKLMWEFTRAHAGPKGLSSGSLQGSERSKIGIIDRAVDFIGRFLDSTRLETKCTTPSLANTTEATATPQFCSHETLLAFANQMLELLGFFPIPRLTAVEKWEARKRLLKAVNDLTQQKGLLRSNTWKVPLFTNDVPRLLETAFLQPIGCSHEIVRNGALIVACLELGVRLGSLIPTNLWPTEYSRWKDVHFGPMVDESSRVIGIDVGFTVKHLHGPKQWNRHWTKRVPSSTQVFVGTRTSPTEAVVDLGTWLLALAVRQGVFDRTAVDELWENRRLLLRCRKEWENKPIFAAVDSATGQWLPSAVSGDTANEMFAELCCNSSQASQNSCQNLGNFRRGFALRSSLTIGAANTRQSMGFLPKPTVEVKPYEPEKHTLTSFPHDQGTSERTNTILRQTRNDAFQQAKFEKEMRRRSAFQVAWELLKVLEFCNAHHSGYWSTLPPYCTNPNPQSWPKNYLQVSIEALQNVISEVAEHVRNNHFPSYTARCRSELLYWLDEQTLCRLQILQQRPSCLVAILQDDVSAKAESSGIFASRKAPAGHALQTREHVEGVAHEVVLGERRFWRSQVAAMSRATEEKKGNNEEEKVVGPGYFAEFERMAWEYEEEAEETEFEKNGVVAYDFCGRVDETALHQAKNALRKLQEQVAQHNKSPVQPSTNPPPEAWMDLDASTYKRELLKLLIDV